MQPLLLSGARAVTRPSLSHGAMWWGGLALTVAALFSGFQLRAGSQPSASGSAPHPFDKTISREDSHVPSGGLVRDGELLMDFHSFPLRIMEVPDKPQEAVLKVGFSEGSYGRSKGGRTFSGWNCDHLPYLVEIDNWGVGKQPGQPGAGSIWIWGYDEITWFAHQSRDYRASWLRYAWGWVRRTDPNGFLQMPGSRTLVSPLDQKRWYYANNPSAAVPDGYGDEEAIHSGSGN